jgi:outer membrane receptor protein involved in Fe transport
MTVFDLDRDAFVTLRDRDQTKAPRWQYSFGWRWQMLPALVGSFAVEGRDSSFFGYYHNQKLGAYTVLNASLAYRFQSLELRAWARNLLNTDYAVHGLYFANDPRDGFTINRRYEQFGEPRVYGVEVNWSF